MKRKSGLSAVSPVLIALAAAVTPSVKAADTLAPAVGVHTLSAPAPERGNSIDVTLWYPAAAPGTPEMIGDNAIFQGVAVGRGAPVIAGPLPLILLSHGGLRAAPNLGAWIAAHLAARGFVVAVPRQPDPRTLTAAAATREIWLRPADLSATLSAVENDAAWHGRIDKNRIGVLGFELGGTAALALAGARLDAEGYRRACDRDEHDPDCRWFAQEGVDLHAVDAGMVARSNRDPRVKAVVAIDPEWGASFTPTSLGAIAVPAAIVDLGRPAQPGSNAASLAQAIPGATYERLPDATRSSAFNACKPQGPTILRDDGDDETLCTDGDGRSRADIHARLSAMIEAAFSRNGF